MENNLGVRKVLNRHRKSMCLSILGMRVRRAHLYKKNKTKQNPDQTLLEWMYNVKLNQSYSYLFVFFSN